MHILFLLQTAFSLWMLVDAAKRRAEYYWFFIIMTPFGELIYFVCVKMRDPEIGRLAQKLLEKPETLKELAYQAELSPSIHNKLRYAQALHDDVQYKKAIELFEAVLAQREDSKEARYGLALCAKNLKESERALEAFESLVAEDMSFKDYSVCTELATLYSVLGQQDKAIAALEAVVKKSEHIAHRIELARHLQKSGEQTRVREILENVLIDYENSPKFAKKRDRLWAREAKGMLRGM